ncbi:DUF2528 family protein [Mucilaginibacter sp. P25]|uniref:DUF2528 family protein n=1 Tax=Mucilaginibacter sp. P25 TaxID=3423945 RepID=UPI003D79737F
MAKKMYEIEYGPTWWECTVVVDHTPEVDNAIREMVEFWGGWENLLKENKGDYTKTFLKGLARDINYIQAEYDYNLTGVIQEYAEGREGWCKMDGSAGIEITAIDDFDFSYDQYVVSDGLPVDDEEEPSNAN